MGRGTKKVENRCRRKTTRTSWHARFDTLPNKNKKLATFLFSNFPTITSDVTDGVQGASLPLGS